MSKHQKAEDFLPARHPLLSGYWTWDIPHDRIFGCASMMDYFGHTVEDAAAGLTIAACTNSIDMNDRGRVSHSIRDAIDGHHPYRETFRVHTLTQGTRRILAQGRCYYDVKGDPSFFPGWFIDVTGTDEGAVTSLLHCRYLTELARDAASNAGQDFLCYLLEIALREADARLAPKRLGGSWTH